MALSHRVTIQLQDSGWRPVGALLSGEMIDIQALATGQEHAIWVVRLDFAVERELGIVPFIGVQARHRAGVSEGTGGQRDTFPGRMSYPTSTSHAVDAGLRLLANIDRYEVTAGSERADVPRHCCAARNGGKQSIASSPRRGPSGPSQHGGISLAMLNEARYGAPTSASSR